MKILKTFLISLLVCFILSMFSSEKIYAAEEKISLEKIYEAYEKVLVEGYYMDMYKVVPKTFDIKDINKDGIPELLMGDAYQILTYKDDYAVWLFDSWVMCEMYYSESTSRIMYAYSWNEYSDWYIYEIDMEAGEFKTIDRYSYNEGVYYHGEEKSTKDNIMKDIDKLMPGKKLLSTPYKNTEENRDKYLSPIRISKEKVTIYARGEKSKLTIEGTDSTIKWHSSDKSIVKVTKHGNLYGLKPGKCTITAEIDGKTYECKVTVKKNRYK